MAHRQIAQSKSALPQHTSEEKPIPSGWVLGTHAGAVIGLAKEKWAHTHTNTKTDFQA
jgi:hypothetical protein